MNNYKIKPFEELTLADDFMFGEVMRDETVCKLFLESLINKKLQSIKCVQREAYIKDKHNSHGVRLDIFAKDESGNSYNIEMQNSNNHNIELRSRYYTSSMDRGALGEGIDYNNLPDTYVIFVCTFDYVGRGLAKYEKISYFNGDESMPCNDRSHLILLNSKYKILNADASIDEFLSFVNGKAARCATTLGMQISNRIEVIRENNSFKEAYMVSSLQYMESMRDAKNEGIQEGIIKEHQRMLTVLHMTEEEYQARCRENVEEQENKKSV